jgi:hypothetical protein
VDILEKLCRDLKSILKGSLLSFLGVMLLSLILDGSGRWAAGIAIGFLASAVNFFILYLNIILLMTPGRSKAFFFILYVGYIARLLLYFNALTAALRIGGDAFASSIAGMMVIKLAIFSNTIFGRWKSCVFFRK